jgi:serine protease Do
MRPSKPIAAATCEAQSRGEIATAIQPSEDGDFDLFSFQDPFGLRKAIVPVLLNDGDGLTRGMGTAFHVDGWGTFLTADHVIDFVRQRSKQVSTSRGDVRYEMAHRDVCPILLFGMGLVFGKPPIPADALGYVTAIRSPIRQRADPLTALAGRTEFEAASDIAVLEVGNSIPEKMTGTLAVRLSGVGPRVGEVIVAIGFPELDCQPVDEEGMRYLLSEGMSAAYGRITALHPTGVRNNPTPVIEVEAKWPSGMSGGPVFNESGQVIGLVSRSWSDVGYAACLSMMPWFRTWMDSVDAANPCGRLGWGVLNDDNDLLGLYKNRDDAVRHQSALGFGVIVFGSSRIGSADFIPQ